MTDMQSKRRRGTGAGQPDQRVAEAVADRLAGLLPEEALEDALKGLEPEEITGPGGLLTQLAGRVIETALGAELTEHLGHPPGGVPARRATSATARPPRRCRPIWARSRSAPRATATAASSRSWSRKRQTRLAGLDDKILDLYAGGMSVARHRRAPDRALRRRDRPRHDQPVTDAVLEDVAAWRTRPLERVYPIVYFDAMFVKVREDRSVRAPRLLPGDRRRPATATARSWGSGGRTTEGAKFWLAVLNDLNRRGVARRPDRLRRRPERASPRRSRPSSPKPGCRPASSTRSAPRCATSTTATAEGRPATCGRSTPPPTPTTPSPSSSASSSEWGERYPMIGRRLARATGSTSSRSSRCPHELRRAVYTTNTIEALHRQIRKAIKTRGHFPAPMPTLS